VYGRGLVFLNQSLEKTLYFIEGYEIQSSPKVLHRNLNFGAEKGANLQQFLILIGT